MATRTDALSALDTLVGLFPRDTIAMHTTSTAGAESYKVYLFGFLGDPTPMLPFVTDALLGPEVDGCREFTARIRGVPLAFTAGVSAARLLIEAGVAHQERRVEVVTIAGRAETGAA